MLRSSRTGLSKIGSLSRATAILVGALVALFGVIAGPLLSSTAASAATTGSASAYTAIVPFRALGSATTGVSIAAGATTNVQVTGTTVPAGATAAVVNITAAGGTAASYLTAYPAGGTQPSTSNVNFVAGQTVANLATVPLSASGALTVYNYVGTVNVDVDVEGYYTATTVSVGSGLYDPVNPYRVFGGAATGSPIGSGAVSSATVTGGASGVPATATAVAVNLTVAGGTAASYITAYPAGATQPVVSSLNFVAGQTIANRDIVDVGTNGAIDLYNYVGTVNVDVDVDGYYTGSGGSGSTFVPLTTPERLTDTRTATNVNGSTIAANASESFNLSTTAGGIPSTATAVATNITVIPGADPGYITVYPTGVTTPPTASDVNWAGGEGPVANFTLADTAGTTGGSVNVYNYTGSPADLLIDAYGYFTPASSTALPVGTDGILVPGTTAVVGTPITANGSSTETVTALVKETGVVVANDTVLFTVSPSAGCGTLNAATAQTTAAGIATVTYTAPTYVASGANATAATCTITAEDADYAQTGTGTIAQSEPANVVNLTGASASIVAGAGTTDLLTATVTSVTPGSADADTVAFTVASNPTGACGTVGTASGTTGAAGTTPVTATYTDGTATGFCTISAQEGNGHGVGTFVIDQTATPAIATPTVVLTGGASSVVDGGVTPTFTVTVTNSGGAVPADPLMPSVTGVGCPTAAAAIPAAVTTPLITSGTGTATFTYTASAVPATCTVSIEEAKDGVSGSTVITQTAPVSSVGVSAASTTVGPGLTDLITVLPVNPPTTDASSTVTYTVTGVNGFTFCGAAPASSTAAATTPYGTSSTYTAGSGVGFCTITATEGGLSGSVTVDQG